MRNNNNNNKVECKWEGKGRLNRFIAGEPTVKVDQSTQIRNAIVSLNDL